MDNKLTHLISRATRSAFEEIATVWLKTANKEISSFLTPWLPNFLAIASGDFVVEFTAIFLKTFFNPGTQLHDIDAKLIKLINEPLKTAIEQFEIASQLCPKNEIDLQYREKRLRDCLGNLDRACSIAEQEEIPLINLLRGLCTIQVTGGQQEAIIHLEKFRSACADIIQSLGDKVAMHERDAEQNNVEAEKISVPSGLGAGGGLAGLDLAEIRMRKASLQYKARCATERAQKANEIINDVRLAGDYANALIHLIKQPA